MLHKAKGIVLRSVKYGDTSLVTTIFTDVYGVQAYIVQGVRSARPAKNRAGFFQPGTLLDLVVYKQPNKNMQRIREFQPAHIYTSLQEDVIKNSVALFSVEVMLRLLPDDAPMPQLFEFAFDYFKKLDATAYGHAANYPLYFVIQCGKMLGFELKGAYSQHTPYADIAEGGFSGHMPTVPPFITDEDARALSSINSAGDYEEVDAVPANAATRQRLLDWYITFLQRHTDHMGSVRSLAVLSAILH